jgi:hypothetical protein
MQLQALAMGLNCRVNCSLFCKQTEQYKSAVVVALAALKAQVTAEYQGGEGLLLAFLGLAPMDRAPLVLLPLRRLQQPVPLEQQALSW